MELDGITFQSGGMRDLRILPVTTLPTNITEGTLVNHNGEWKRFTGVVDTWDRISAPAIPVLLHSIADPAGGPVRFATTVNISGDKALMTSESGAAYIYDLTSGTLLHTTLPPAGDYGGFGKSGVIDGNNYVVSAYAASAGDKGAILVYNVTTGALLRTIHDPDIDPSYTNDWFGYYMAMSGNLVASSAQNERKQGIAYFGYVYVHDITTGALVSTIGKPGALESAGFGQGLALDGNYLLAGNSQDSTSGLYAGIAWIFNATTGAIIHTLNNPTPISNGYDGFGKKGMALKGNYCAVGTGGGSWDGKNPGLVHVFDVTTGALLYTITNPNAYGTDVADAFGETISIDGNLMIVGTPQEDDASGESSGKAYIFDVTTGNLLHTLDNPNPVGTSEADWFGGAVAIEGDNIIVSAKFEDLGAELYSGHAYIYKMPQ